MSRAATRPTRSSSRVSWPALVIDACAHLQASAPAEALEARVREANPSLEWNSGSFKAALRSKQKHGLSLEDMGQQSGPAGSSDGRTILDQQQSQARRGVGFCLQS